MMLVVRSWGGVLAGLELIYNKKLPLNVKFLKSETAIAADSAVACLCYTWTSNWMSLSGPHDRSESVNMHCATLVRRSDSFESFESILIRNEL